MKKFFGMLTALMGLSSLIFAQYNSSQNQPPSSYGQSSTMQGQYSQGQAMQQMGPATSDCDHLSQQEQQFAMQLSVLHRTMFCRHFSVSQRIEAMTLASSAVQGLQGQQTSISPDEAVEVVMKNARTTNGSNSSGQQQNQNNSNYGYPSGSSSNKPYSNY